MVLARADPQQPLHQVLSDGFSSKPSRELTSNELAIIGFAAGAAYGVTSVVVGQPLDTVKTTMQAQPGSLRSGIGQVTLQILKSNGLSGLYRGGLPIAIGGALFRSAQFGFYESTLSRLRQHTPAARFGFLDWQIFVAGLAGGVARGVVEAPFEYIKVRRQVNQQWSFHLLYEGSAVTIGRNALMFGAFSIYRDVVPSFFPGGLSPFWLGAVSSNLAWLTIWPLDVIKSQVQSGNYPGWSAGALLKEAARTGSLFRGVMPGLLRSTIANGSAMVVYKEIEKSLQVQLLEIRGHHGHGERFKGSNLRPGHLDDMAGPLLPWAIWLDSTAGDPFLPTHLDRMAIATAQM